MNVYGLTLVSLIEQLQKEYPALPHIWYADDGNVAGPFPILKTLLQRLCLGKPYAYFVQPEKCQLVTTHAPEAQKYFRSSSGATVKIQDGSKFLGGHIYAPSTSLTGLPAKFPLGPRELILL